MDDDQRGKEEEEEVTHESAGEQISAEKKTPAASSQIEASNEIQSGREKESSEFLKEWQGKLLPLMGTYFVVSSIFFFAASSWQFYSMSNYMATNGAFKSELDLDKFNVGSLKDTERLNAVMLTILEAEAMTRRYTQANVALMARVWITYLGFFTGMMLAMVGAVFILGKLNTTLPSKASGSYEKYKVELISTSPGLIMAILGTLLIITSILVKQDIKVTDGSLYTDKIQSRPNATSFEVDK